MLLSSCVPAQGRGKEYQEQKAGYGVRIAGMALTDHNIECPVTSLPGLLVTNVEHLLFVWTLLVLLYGVVSV